MLEQTICEMLEAHVRERLENQRQRLVHAHDVEVTELTRKMLKLEAQRDSERQSRTEAVEQLAALEREKQELKDQLNAECERLDDLKNQLDAALAAQSNGAADIVRRDRRVAELEHDLLLRSQLLAAKNAEVEKLAARLFESNTKCLEQGNGLLRESEADLVAASVALQADPVLNPRRFTAETVEALQERIRQQGMELTVLREFSSKVPLLNRIKDLEKALATALADVAHWRANHDNMVAHNKQLRDRPDLGDRAASVAALRARCEDLERRLDRQESQ